MLFGAADLFLLLAAPAGRVVHPLPIRAGDETHADVLPGGLGRIVRECRKGRVDRSGGLVPDIGSEDVLAGDLRLSERVVQPGQVEHSRDLVTVGRRAARPLGAAVQQRPGHVVGLADRAVARLIGYGPHVQAVADRELTDLDLAAARCPQQRPDGEEQDRDERRDPVGTDPANDIFDLLTRTLAAVARPLVAESA